jgi:hypothetical protein
MEIALPGTQPPTPRLTAKLVEVWVEQCNEFRRRERRDIIEQQPSREKLVQYRAELGLMLRSARILEMLMKDPEFPASELVPEVSGKLLQLESSWRSLNNPMSAAEADALLNEVFPDDPALEKVRAHEARAGRAS